LIEGLLDAASAHEHFARAEEFCALYDNPAFDPTAETLPVSEFEPKLRGVQH
jgi:hypothetical protein